MRLGVLDVGSNTVHLLVVDARAGGPPVPAASHKRELRLAEAIDERGNLSGQGVEQLVGMVTECAERAEELGCSELVAFVTSALREAANGEAVLATVRERTGLVMQVLSGRDEARATFLAARRWYGWSAGSLALLDIGGGSLEMAAGTDEDPDVALSVALGAGRMTREYFTDLPRTKSAQDDAIKALRKHARSELGAVVGELIRRGPFDRAVGTSKTFRTLGRICGSAPSSDGPFVRRRLRLADLTRAVDEIAALPEAKRADLPGVSEGRAGQILAGAVVAESAMRLAGLDELDLCPWALREGVILHWIDQQSWNGRR